MIPVGNFSRFFLYHGRRDGNEEGEEAANGGDDPENLQARTDTPAVGSHPTRGEIRPPTLALRPKVTPEAKPMLRAR